MLFRSCPRRKHFSERDPNPCDLIHQQHLGCLGDRPGPVGLSDHCPPPVRPGNPLSAHLGQEVPPSGSAALLSTSTFLRHPGRLSRKNHCPRSRSEGGPARTRLCYFRATSWWLSWRHKCMPRKEWCVPLTRHPPLRPPASPPPLPATVHPAHSQPGSDRRPGVPQRHGAGAGRAGSQE